MFLEGEKRVYNIISIFIMNSAHCVVQEATIHLSIHTLPSLIHTPSFQYMHLFSKWNDDAAYFFQMHSALSLFVVHSPSPLPTSSSLHYLSPRPNYYMGEPLGARLVFGWKPNIGSHSSVWNNTVTVCIITTRLSEELLWSLWMIGGSVIVSCLALFERPGNHDDLVPFLVRYIMFI